MWLSNVRNRVHKYTTDRYTKWYCISFNGWPKYILQLRPANMDPKSKCSIFGSIKLVLTGRDPGCLSARDPTSPCHLRFSDWPSEDAVLATQRNEETISIILSHSKTIGSKAYYLWRKFTTVAFYTCIQYPTPPNTGFAEILATRVPTGNSACLNGRSPLTQWLDSSSQALWWDMPSNLFL